MTGMDHCGNDYNNHKISKLPAVTCGDPHTGIAANKHSQSSLLR